MIGLIIIIITMKINDMKLRMLRRKSHVFLQEEAKDVEANAQGEGTG